MITFDKEELLKIAKLSALTLDDDEIETFANELREVLEYTSELEEVEPPQTLEVQTNVNVFREDKTQPYDSESVLKQAPDRKDTFFSVPKIL
jgi:aspartyl-tRNA(Asn)/glutamyl-tRNA(Gln) amidotransferase subunit C